MPDSLTRRFARLVDDAPPPGERDLCSLLERQARAFGDRTLTVVGSESRSYAQCRDDAARFAGTLAAAGIRAGDRVAIMTRNRIEFLTAFLGSIWAGAIAVPVNTAIRGRVLAHVLEDSGARLLVIDGELAGCLGGIEIALSELEEVWVADAKPGAPGAPDASGAPEVPGSAPALRPVRPWPAPGEALPRRDCAPGEVCAILYTSGTTGPSKGVAYPSDHLYWWGAVMSRMSDIDAASVSFTTLPLFHIHALSTFVQSLIRGARCVITERFSASRFWAQAIEAGATHGCLIGSMGSILLAQPVSPLDRAHGIRTVFSSSMRAVVWQAFSDRFDIPRRVGGYGSTETNAAFFAERGWEIQGNMGHVVPGFHAQVVDDHDEPVPDGTAGELVLRSDLPFSFSTGYWRRPEATVSAWRNLWFHSGDLVVRDDRGVFRFVGRLKESIRRRGENISCWEVEQAILSHERVSDAAAFGVPSPLGDEDVMAVVVLREGDPLAPQALMRHLDGRLAYFAIPRYLEFVRELPLTENGKIKRTELRERGVTATTWDRESVGYVVARVR